MSGSAGWAGRFVSSQDLPVGIRWKSTSLFRSAPFLPHPLPFLLRRSPENGIHHRARRSYFPQVKTRRISLATLALSHIAMGGRSRVVEEGLVTQLNVPFETTDVNAREAVPVSL